MYRSLQKLHHGVPRSKVRNDEYWLENIGRWLNHEPFGGVSRWSVYIRTSICMFHAWAKSDKQKRDECGRPLALSSFVRQVQSHSPPPVYSFLPPCAQHPPYQSHKVHSNSRALCRHPTIPCNISSTFSWAFTASNNFRRLLHGWSPNYVYFTPAYLARDAKSTGRLQISWVTT